MDLSLEQLREQRRPRFGTRNPERAYVPFWDEQIRTGERAWSGLRRFVSDEQALALSDDGPTWSFHRFGSTQTRLPSGQVVCIAGEHEDSYDPDFCIYNDVVVFDPDGTWQVYLYPREVFHPTDFHAAVWVEPYIYIIGSLGYREDRVGDMPVFRLDTRTWEIDRVMTRGSSPPRFHRCVAELDSSSNVIRVVGGHWYPSNRRKRAYNDRERMLDLQTLTWSDGEVVNELPPGPFGEACGVLQRVKNFNKAYDLCDVVRYSVSFRHPLWGRALCPLYADSGQCLFQVIDRDQRFALCELCWGESRSMAGDVPCIIFEGRESLESYLSDATNYNEHGWFDLTRARQGND